MPYYIISSESCVKNNEYKFGYSSKSKHELLRQYEKNKRVIPNPFILKMVGYREFYKRRKKNT